MAAIYKCSAATESSCLQDRKKCLPTIPVPTRRFSHVHINIVGLLPSSQGYSYLLTITSNSAESCVRDFLSTWVSRFGVPAVLTSNRGAQFTSSVWSGVCVSLGILASTTTSFYPQSNGMMEWFHCSLKSALCSGLASLDWFLHLPLVLLGLRMVPKDDTGLASLSPRLFIFLLSLVLDSSLEVPSCLPLPTSCSTVSASSASCCLSVCEVCVCSRRCLYSFSSTLVPRSLPGTPVQRQVLPPSDWFQDRCCFCRLDQASVF